MMSYSKFKSKGRRIVAFCSSLLLSFQLVSAQSSQPVALTGSVSASADGLPLAAASVSVSGTSQVSQTDEAGNFSVRVSIPATLTVSFTGYVTQTVTVTEAKPLAIVLVSDEEQLAEVVVVAYGTQNRREVTGSISSVSGADVKEMPVNSGVQQVQGKLPGVTKKK